VEKGFREGFRKIGKKGFIMFLSCRSVRSFDLGY
jgi:hypothetical protein